MGSQIFTVGHSTHSIEVFINLLTQHGIYVIVDVRSAPYSRFNLQFNKDALSKSLLDVGVKYVFWGKNSALAVRTHLAIKMGRSNSTHWPKLNTLSLALIGFDWALIVISEWL